jgi:hypothetical protein
MGGGGWTCNLVFNQVASIAVAGYYKRTEGGEDGDFAWKAIVAANWALAVSLVVFLEIINKSYKPTFVSFETNRERTELLFREHTAPGLKLAVTVEFHEAVYAHFRDDVKAFVMDSIGEWEEERPLWWTDALLASVPDDMLVGEQGEGALKRKRGAKARAEAGGSVRKSTSRSLRSSMGYEDGEEGKPEAVRKVTPVA